MRSVTAHTAPRSITPAIIAPVLASPTTMSTMKDYWKLSKGHLSVWVALSALPGYLVSAPFSLPVATGVFAGTALACASSQALNQIQESVRDAKMARTKNRPIPTGKISVSSANMYAVSTAALGCTALTISASGSLAPAVIALSTIGLYVNVYTRLKPVSPYNTHVGAVAGSLPVLIGFGCAGGFPIFLTPEPWVLFALQTIWQFPHFYPLAWMYREDYIAGGYKMFPLTDTTGIETAKMCLPYMMALAVLPIASSALGATSWMFPISGSAVNALWLRQYWAFSSAPSKCTARTFFLGSLWYLILMMGLYVIHLRDLPGSELHQWRLRLKARMADMCVHEREANDPVIPASLCPVTKASPVAAVPTECNQPVCKTPPSADAVIARECEQSEARI